MHCRIYWICYIGSFPLYERMSTQDIFSFASDTDTDVPGIVDVLDQVNDTATYYLAEKGTKQYLVKVTKDFITTNELADKVDVKKFIVGKNKFKKGYQIL